MTSLDLRDALQLSLGDSYRLDRELGGGGMGRAFLAEETALGRPVVVQVLAPDVTPDVLAERFAGEIRFSARTSASRKRSVRRVPPAKVPSTAARHPRSHG